MKRIKLYWTHVFSLLSVDRLVAACVPPLSNLSSARSGLVTTGKQRFVGTLRVALTASPNLLDCPQLSDLNASLVALQLYDSLLWVNDQGHQLAPALAERWTISADGTAYTFYLRRGVVFHNGEPFTADAVVTAWQRGSRPAMSQRYRWTMVSAVEKVDDYTVILRSKQPNALILRTIANTWCMVPPRYLAAVDEKGFLTHPVGTGPFTFAGGARDEQIVLKANPTYWAAGLPKLAELIFRPIPQAFNQAAAVRTGEIDLVSRLSSNEVAPLKGMTDVQVLHYPVDRWTGNGGDAYPRLFGALGGAAAPFSAWSDPQLDAKLMQIRTTLDEEKRAALYQALQQEMVDNPPFLYLYALETFEVVQRRVQNYQPRPSELAYFKSMFVTAGQ